METMLKLSAIAGKLNLQFRLNDNLTEALSATSVYKFIKSLYVWGHYSRSHMQSGMEYTMLFFSKNTLSSLHNFIANEQ